jgi:DNA-binding IclR family transcriptional regulator
LPTGKIGPVVGSVKPLALHPQRVGSLWNLGRNALRGMRSTMSTIRRTRPGGYGDKVPGAIQSVERAAAILQLVAESSAPLGLTDVAQSLDLAKATAHGLLRTLQDVGFLEQDETTGKYAIGAGLLDLSHARVDPHDLRSHAMNWADSLASRSGEAVRIATFINGVPTIVHHVFRPDDTLQRMEIGERLPVHATALGKALLAWGGFPYGRPDADFDRFTQHTVTDPRELTRALVDVRRQGWSCDVEEHHPGEASLAAPVRGAVGRVVGAIGIAGPVDRVCDAGGRPRSHLVSQVTDTARSVSRDLVTSRR